MAHLMTREETVGWCERETKNLLDNIKQTEEKLQKDKTPREKENLLNWIDSYKQQIRFFIATNPNTPGEELAEIAKEDNISTQAAIVQNPSTPGETLLEFYLHGPEPLKRHIKKNPNIPDVLRVWLANNSSFAGLTFEEFLKRTNNE